VKKRVVVVLALLSAPVLATAFRGFAGMRGDANTGWNTANGSPAISGPPSPTFDLVAGSTTPNDLSDSLTVNSNALNLVCSFTAQDISGTSIVGRTQSGSVTFNEAGTGTSPVSSRLTPFRALDANERTIQYSLGQKYHQGSAGDCDIGTEDFAVEMVLGPTITSSAFQFNNADATAGYFIQNNATTSYRFRLRTGGIQTNVDAGSGSVGSWNHVMWFFDRDEPSATGSFGYTNGTVGTGVDVSARSGTLSSSAAATLGASTSNETSIVSFRIWKCPSSTPQCFAGGASNPQQWRLIARNRAAQALGLLPSIAAGVQTPTDLSRATQAMTDVVDGSVRHLYSMGSGAPRIARRTHSGGTAVIGHLNEPSVSNLALQSQTLGTTWTAITVGDNVLADAFAGADLGTTGDDIDGNNSAGEHGLRQAITLTAATHTFSAWARPGAQTFVALRDNTIASGTAWFNLTTCTSASCVVGQDCPAAVGTVQAGVTQATASRWPIDTTGDGVADVNLCRVSITYTGTAALNDHDLLCAPSDGVTSYTDADATADCGFWGVRVEAFPAPTSYSATTTVAVARNADDVRFDGASHYTGSPSTIDVQVLCPSFNVSTTSTFVSVATNSANYARLGIDATNDRALADALVTSITQWSIISPSGDVSDGLPHSIRHTMQTDNITAYYDGVNIGTDATATLPPVATSLIYFSLLPSSSNSACLISRARFWSSLVAP
jgi:hypothetical protein